MKIAVVAGLLLVASTAAADPADPADPAIYYRQQPSAGVWIDVGAQWARVDPGNGNSYAGKLVHFAPNVMIGRLFYLGAEVEIGTISGASDSAIARGESPQPTMDPAVSGSLASMKAVIGARAFAGSISGGAELAAGIRHAALEDANNVELAAVGDKGVVEARARLDWWATPKLTVGAAAGLDLTNGTNIVFGLQLGLHFSPYDHSRSR